MKASLSFKKWLIQIGKYFLFGSVAVVSGYYLIYPHVFHCQTIGFSNFVRVNEHLYVSPSLSKEQLDNSKQIVEIADKRVSEFWGERTGNATLILCSNPAEYQKYCHSNEGAGCSLGTPWGQNYIVLNPYGLNEDVVAHEMCHDELLTRLGWWKVTARIPQWFNEGLALMLDRRFVEATDSLQRYREYKDEWLYLTRGAQQILELEKIAGMKGFFGGDALHVQLAYMTSGMEVSRWLAVAGQSGLDEFTIQMNAGVPFIQSYRNVLSKGEEKLSPTLKQRAFRDHPFRF